MASDSLSIAQISLAVRSNDVEAVRAQLTEGRCDLSSHDDEGQTAVHVAADEGNAPIVRLLLESGGDGASLNVIQLAPLHLAAYGGHADSVRALLESGTVYLDARDELGQTALHLAAYQGSAEVVQLLLEAGTDKDARDKRGRTPLHEAAFCGHVAAVGELVDAGCNILAVDEEQRTALHLATANGYDGVAQTLLEAPMKALVARADAGGETVTDIARRKKNEDMVAMFKRALKFEPRPTMSFTSLRRKKKKMKASPSIFLSYNWDHQPKVKNLYRALTERGYTCWMDIHMMGGGDTMPEKIERGISNCEVLIACVTPQYVMSLICKKEVSLASARRKNIIPVMFEDIGQWPPTGAMGITFADLIYIPAHRHPQELDKWDGPIFEELKAKLDEMLTHSRRSTPVHAPSDRDNARSHGISCYACCGKCCT